jgi:probable F420-dependent oxidoreductase
MAASALVEQTRQRLGPVGVFGQVAGALRGLSVGDETHFVTEVERFGYRSFWVGEGVGGKDVFVRHGISLARTSRLVLGSGIANVWARHPRTAHAASATLAEAYPGRFVLGLGIGHRFQAESVGESNYRPLHQLREYLEVMDPGPDDAIPSPVVAYPRVLGAVGPKMTELAAERTDGVHPFVQPVVHTAAARNILGPDRLLIPQLSVLLTNERKVGLAMAGKMFERIRAVPAYARSWRSFGYSEAEIADASPSLVEAIFAIGDEAAIADRVREHLDAGADHVLISPVAANAADTLAQLEKLAPAVIR